jgi:hypothetical protein
MDLLDEGIQPEFEEFSLHKITITKRTGLYYSATQLRVTAFLQPSVVILEKCKKK